MRARKHKPAGTGDQERGLRWITANLRARALAQVASRERRVGVLKDGLDLSGGCRVVRDQTLRRRAVGRRRKRAVQTASAHKRGNNARRAKADPPAQRLELDGVGLDDVLARRHRCALGLVRATVRLRLRTLLRHA